jgi:hypothetical protein
MREGSGFHSQYEVVWSMDGYYHKLVPLCVCVGEQVVVHYGG